MQIESLYSAITPSRGQPARQRSIFPHRFGAKDFLDSAFVLLMAFSCDEHCRRLMHRLGNGVKCLNRNFEPLALDPIVHEGEAEPPPEQEGDVNQRALGSFYPELFFSTSGLIMLMRKPVS